MTNPITSFLKSMTEDTVPVNGDRERRHSRLLATLLIIIIPISLVITIFPGMIYYGNAFNVMIFLVVLISAFFLVFGYVLSTSINNRHIMIGVIAISIFIIFSSALIDINLLPFLVVPLLLCAIFLSARVTILVIIINLVGILLVPIYVMEEEIDGKIVWGFNFMLIISVLLLIIIRHRRRLELDQQVIIQESQEQMKALMATSKDAIVTLDKEGRVVSWNKVAKKIFGYNQTDAKGMSIADIIPSLFEFQSKMGGLDLTNDETLKNIHRTGEKKGFSGRRKDKTKFPLTISLASWRMDKDMFVTAIIKDVSRIKEMEENLRTRNKELEALNKTLLGREMKMIELKKEIERLLENNN